LLEKLKRKRETRATLDAAAESEPLGPLPMTLDASQLGGMVGGQALRA
jgi:hypothetical protein